MVESFQDDSAPTSDDVAFFTVVGAYPERKKRVHSAHVEAISSVVHIRLYTVKDARSGQLVLVTDDNEDATKVLDVRTFASFVEANKITHWEVVSVGSEAHPRDDQYLRILDTLRRSGLTATAVSTTGDPDDMDCDEDCFVVHSHCSIGIVPAAAAESEKRKPIMGWANLCSSYFEIGINCIADSIRESFRSACLSGRTPIKTNVAGNS